MARLWLRLLTIATGLVGVLAAGVQPASAHHPSTAVVRTSLLLPTVGGDEPDLFPLLPASAPGAVVVDLEARPGRVLYRFDSVIWNAGGALDLYCDPCSGSRRVFQAVWPGGAPAAGQLPTARTKPGPAARITELTQLGADMAFSNAVGHNHFHYQEAARYELLLPDGPARTDKVGFCMFDTYSDADSGTAYYRGQGGGWCAPGNPGAAFVRMGISRGWGDYYGAGLADQWIDVTGLTPGTYTLRATIDPAGRLIESNRDNNVLDVARVVPGVLVADVDVALAARGEIPLVGTIVGGDVAVENGTRPERVSPDAALAFRVVEQPRHGSVTVVAGGGPTATATYAATPGFVGTDSFRVVATDPRGLESPAATVTVRFGVASPSATLPPAVAGLAQVGATLTASTGEWAGTAPLELRLQWQRCNAGGTACADLAGAAVATYVPAAGDIGSRLRVRVDASGPGGSASATSTPTDIVVTPPAQGTTDVAPTGGASGGGPPGGATGPPAELPAIAPAGRTPTVGFRRGRIAGTPAADLLLGTTRADLILGRTGDDRIASFGGADIVHAGAGDDLVTLGSARDVADLGAGHDRVRAADGASDAIVCGPGRDTAIVDPLDDVDRSCEEVVTIAPKG